MKPLRLALALLTAGVSVARACTIFVLADENRALFFNNEDWFNKATRLWFVPAGEGHLGCAFIGFDNGWAQGGFNAAGLAYDWVSGFEESYTPAPELKPVRGNPAERMLETCTTVAEAIAFFRAHREPDFRRSRILIADRTGASVVIGARNGQLYFAPMQGNRGFGYGRVALERELATNPEPTVARGAEILRACLQGGDGGTKYSNIFDLKRGEIILFPTPTLDESVLLRLADEFAKGGHSYEIPKIRAQLVAAPQPLLPNQFRFYLDRFPPIADDAPAVTARVRRLLEEAAAGRWTESEFTPSLWQQLAPARESMRADLQRLGGLRSIALVEQRETAEGRTYRYVAEFDRARVLSRYVLDAKERIAAARTEFSEMKPDAPAATH